jgi:hypothetical protein
VIVIASFVGGGALGFAAAGLAGAFAGSLGAALVCALFYGMSRMKQTGRLEHAPPPALDGLDPQQRMTVMTAMMGGGQSESFKSELLAKLEEAAATAQDDPEDALAAVELLQDQHPRNPAVHAELARRHFALGNEAEALVSLADALGCALDGGMNPMAARLFSEFTEHRDALPLNRRHYPQLARVLRSRGESEGANWCDARAQR